MSKKFTGGVTTNNLFRISIREGNFKRDYYVKKSQVICMEVSEQTPFPTSFHMLIEWKHTSRIGGEQIDIDDRELADNLMFWFNGTHVFEEGD